MTLNRDVNARRMMYFKDLNHTDKPSFGKAEHPEVRVYYYIELKSEENYYIFCLRSENSLQLQCMIYYVGIKSCILTDTDSDFWKSGQPIINFLKPLYFGGLTQKQNCWLLIYLTKYLIEGFEEKKYTAAECCSFKRHRKI